MLVRRGIEGVSEVEVDELFGVALHAFHLCPLNSERSGGFFLLMMTHLAHRDVVNITTFSRMSARKDEI